MWLRELWEPEDHWAHYFYELLQRSEYFDHCMQQGAGPNPLEQRMLSLWNPADLALSRIAAQWLDNIPYKDAHLLHIDATRSECDVLASLIAGYVLNTLSL